MSVLLILLLPALGLVVARPETFIHNGDEAKDKLHSVIIFALPREGDHRGALGGGSILSERYILTAAHLCANAQQFLIGYGNLEATKVKRITARSALIHSHYNPTTLENDLAVITLPADQKIDLSLAKSIAVAKNVQDVGSVGLVASFGFTSNEATSISEKLLVAQQFIVANKGCETAFSRSVHRNQFCGQNQPPAETEPPAGGGGNRESESGGDDNTLGDADASGGNANGSGGNTSDDNTDNGSGGGGGGDGGSDTGFMGMQWSRALSSPKAASLSSVCFGDTGSALVRKKGEKYIAFGLLSRIPGGCNNLRPALYTRLSSYSQWIEDVTLGQASVVEL